MSVSFLDLPLEIQLIIANMFQPVKYSHFADNILLPLSSTCKTLRMHFADRIFRTLRFTNETQNAKMSLSIAKAYGRCSRHLLFVALNTAVKNTAPTKSRLTRATRQSWDLRQDELVCPALRELLHGTHTPNASSMTVMWNLKTDAGHAPESGLQCSRIYDNTKTASHTYCSKTTEHLAQTRFEELYEPWRAMIRLVWETLARNQNVTHLEILSMVPRPSEVFFSASWRLFMGRLNDLRICFDEERHGPPSVCTFAGLRQFAKHLNRFMLSAAHSLQYLRLEGPSSGVMGLRPQILSDKFHLPNMKGLVLEDICVSRGLVDFLDRHSGNLASIFMWKCYSCHSEGGKDLVQWANVFNALSHFGSTLASFDCFPDDEECFMCIDNESLENETDTEDLEDCFEAFWCQFDVRPFPYAVADSNRGTIIPNPTMVIESFREGEDQRAYNALVVHCDRQRAARKGSGTPHNRAEL